MEEPMGGLPAGMVADGVAAVRALLRIEGEDANLSRGVAAGLEAAEAFTGAVLAGRTFTEMVEPGGGWTRLAHAPVGAIAEVAAADGTALPVDAYAVDIDGDGVGRVRAQGRVRVTYQAGLAASWEALPAAVAQGVCAFVAAMLGGEAPAGDPHALWRAHRRVRL